MTRNSGSLSRATHSLALAVRPMPARRTTLASKTALVLGAMDPSHELFVSFLAHLADDLDSRRPAGRHLLPDLRCQLEETVDGGSTALLFCDLFQQGQRL